jgi:hypothetical protein
MVNNMRKLFFITYIFILFIILTFSVSKQIREVTFDFFDDYRVVATEANSANVKISNMSAAAGGIDVAADKLVYSDASGGVTCSDTVDTIITAALVGAALNGDNIQDDTIDDDSLDFSDITFDDFDYESTWKVWYSDAAGDVTELALGADGSYLMSNGAAVAPSFETPAGGGDVTAAAVMTDHTIVRGDGGAKGVQDSGITIDDSDNVAGVGTFSCGAAGMTVDADGDTTVKSLTMAASATPKITIDDSDGADAYIDNNAADADDGVSCWGVDDSNGDDQCYIEIDGVNERIEPKYSILSTEDISAPATFTTDASGVITLTINAVNYGSDTGKANIPDGFCNAADDVGNWVCLISSAADAYQMTSDDESNQFIITDNASALTANDELDIDGTMACVMCIAAELIKLTGYMGAIPTDGGAP